MAAMRAKPASPLGEKHLFENQTVKLGKAVRRRSVASHVFANSFESLAVTAEALLSAPDGKVTITIKENMKTATPQQSTDASRDGQEIVI